MRMLVGVMEALDVLSQKFVHQPGVAGFAVSQSEGFRLVVFVEDEETEKRVPSTLLGYRVETLVTGRIRILILTEPAHRAVGVSLSTGQAGPKTARWRPVPGGVSIGSVQVTAGTAACRVFEVGTGRALVLSNRHVLWGPRGTEVVQPGVADGGRAPGDVVGRVYSYVDVRPPPEENIVDAATAEPVSPDTLSPEVLDIGVVSDFTEAHEGMPVAMSGRSSCLSSGLVLYTNAVVKAYGYRGMPYAVFKDQIVTTRMASPGDSGSLLVDRASRKAVGLVFAGSDVVTVANRMSHVLRLLNIGLSPLQAAPRPLPIPIASLAIATAPLIFTTASIAYNELERVYKAR